MECPLCKKGSIKIRAGKFIYCSNYKVTKNGSEWINEGDCDFHIPFNQKAFGRQLTEKDMKRVLQGEVIKNQKSDTFELDLENPPFYTKITFAPRPEDKDF